MYGQAGVGKTTFLKKIAVDWARHVQTGTTHSELDKVPFLLFMSKTKQNVQEPFFTALKNQLTSDIFETIKEHIKDYSDKITVLLDCLDQVSCKFSPEFLKEEVCTKFKFIVTTQLQSDTRVQATYTSDKQKCTSDTMQKTSSTKQKTTDTRKETRDRKASASDATQKAHDTRENKADTKGPTKYILLTGMGLNNIKKYIELFYEDNPTADVQKGSELYKSLKDSHGLIENAQNPTTLQMICSVNMEYEMSTDMNITDIFRKYICLQLNAYDRKESQNSEGLNQKKIFKKYKNKILNMGKIAFNGLKEGYMTLQFKPEDVEHIEPKAFSMGLMYKTSDEKAIFHSKFLQEFLAAYYIKHTDNRKGIDTFLNLCSTAEHLFGFLTILTFIMNLSSKKNKQIQKKIGKLILDLHSAGSEHISDHEKIQFLLTMLKGNRKIEFPLPQRILVYLKREGRYVIGRSTFQSFFEQDGSKVHTLAIVTDNTGSLDQVQYLNAPKLAKLEISFSDAEPSITGLRKILTKKKKKKCQKLEIVALKHCHVTDEKAKDLLDCLQENCPQLKELMFDDCTATLYCLAQLTKYSLEQNCKLKYPDCIAEDDIALIGLCMGSYNGVSLPWTDLTQIDLSDKEITPQGIHVLARILTSSSELLLLNLAKCRLGDDDSFKKLIESLNKNCTKLTALNLNQSGISSESAEFLCKQTELLSSLKEFHLVQCFNRDIKTRFLQMTEIFEKGQCSLKILDLSENEIDEEAYEALSCCLQFISRLQALMLNHCKIKSDFAKLLQNVSTSIENLELVGNQMEPATVNNLVEMTHTRQELRGVNLRGKLKRKQKNVKTADEANHKENQFYGFTESVSLEKFFKALETNCKGLKNCDVSYNSLDDQSMDALASMVEHVPDLQTLSLKQCSRKHDKHIEKIGNALMVKCPSLNSLCLKGNSVYPETLVFLTNYLNSRNGKLDIRYPDCCTEDSTSFVDLCKGHWYINQNDSGSQECLQTEKQWADVDELDLTPLKITQNGVSALVEIVTKLPKLKTLFLPPNTVKEHEKMQKLIGNLSNRMESLVLTNNDIGNDTMDILVNMVKRNKQLKHLAISRCQIKKDSGTEKLVEALSESCPLLEEVDLSENETYPSVLVDLSVLRINKSNTKGQIPRIYFPKSATDSQTLVSLLIKSPPDWKELKDINLEEDRPTMHGVDAIEKLLKHTPNIIKFVFSKCGITTFSGPLKSLASNCNILGTLLLQGNKLNSASQDSLCHLLDRLPKLYELNIADCGITETETWESLTMNLSKCSQLNILDISGNQLADSTSKLARIPAKVTGLQELCAKQCHIESGLDMFAESLTANCKSMRILDFSENKIQENTVNALSAALETMPVLQELNFSNCNISHIGMSVIVNSLQSCCHKIHKLDLSGNFATPLALAKLTRYISIGDRQKALKYPQCGTDDDTRLVELCMVSMKYLEKYSAIDLSNRIITASGVEALTLMFSTKMATKLLSLGGCRVNDMPVLQIFLNTLADNMPELEILDLSGNNIESFPKISELVATTPNLQQLYIDDCKLKENATDVQAFIEVIHNTCMSLETLSLMNNFLSPVSVFQLTEESNSRSWKLEIRYPGFDAAIPANNYLYDLLRAIPSKTGWEKRKEIVLCGSKINKAGIEAVAKLLKYTPQLDTFCMSNCLLKETNTMELLLISMQQNITALKQLDLNCNNIGNTGLSPLQETLERNRNLKQLYLNGCLENGDASKIISTIADTKLPLVVLDLSRNLIGKEDVVKMSSMVWKDMENIYLSECGITENDENSVFNPVLSEMAACEGLNMIDLSSNELLPETIARMTEIAFTQKNKGKTVHLHYPASSSTDTKLMDICTSMNWDTQSSLDLSNICFTESAAIAIRIVLGYAASLMELNLEGCTHLQEDMIASYFESIMKAQNNETVLEDLNISGNKMNESALSQLQTLISCSPQLQNLNITNCQVTDSNALNPVLSQIAKYSSDLHGLYLSGNKLDKEGTKVLSNVAEFCQELCTICVAECNITDDVCAKVLLTVLRNKCPYLKMIDFQKNELGPEIHALLTEMMLLSNEQLQVQYPDIPNNHQLPLYDLCQAKTPWAEVKDITFKADELLEIREKAMEAIAVVVQHTSKLEILDAAGFEIGEELCSMHPTAAAGMIEKITNSCPSISNLNLSNNMFDQNTVNVLQVMVEKTGSIQNLNISRCNIGMDVEMLTFIRTLKEKLCGKLQMLDLSRNVCDPHILVDLTILSTELSTTIKYPDCSTDDIDTKDVLSLLRGSPKWETNKTLSFESVEFSLKALLAVADVIKHSPSLENLNIAYSKVIGLDSWNDEAFQKLVNSVVSTNIKTLNLSGQRVAINMPPCLELLKKSQQLNCMQMVHCGFSQTAKLDDLMAELQQGHPDLVTIDMSENYVGQESTPMLTQLVQAKPSLKYLYLRQCHLSENEATKSFLHAVQNTCKNIESIDLSDNKCCAEVIAMLTKMKLHSTCYPTCEPEESDKLLSLLEARDTVWKRLENVDLSETVITEPHGVNAVCCMIESLPNLYHFNIMNCKVNDEDCQQKLIRSLSKNGKLLQTLNLGGNSLREKSIKTLQEAVSNFSNLQSLNLSSFDKDCDDGFRGLIDELNKPETCSQLTELDLSDNVCDPETISKLAIYCEETGVKAKHPRCITDDEAVVKYLRDHSDWKNIQRLDLTEQAVSKSALIGLASITPYMIELQELLFSKCKTGDNLELANLIRSLEDKAPKVKNIDFSFVHLTGEPIEAMAKLMCKESSLETLNLENCKLVNEKQFECFTKQLADSCSNLKTLNMSNNPLGDDGFAAMAGTLKNLQHIETLLLEETELKSCSEVISAIRENCKHIHTLSLKGNSASMVDIFDLTKMIVDQRIERKHLTYPECLHTESPKLLELIKSENNPWENVDKIDLAKEMIPNDGVKALDMVLQVTTETTDINLSGCTFHEPKAINGILKAISSNCASLKSLDISSTTITKEGSKHLNMIIKSSVKLSAIAMSACCIESEDCDKIINTIAKREHILTSVNFSETTASPKSIVSLTKLKMRGCSLLGSYPCCTPKEDERLINILKAEIPWASQKEIDISNPEHLSDEGFCALVEVIKESPNLTSLNLENCRRDSDEYMSYCLEALTGRASDLQILNLTNNFIGPKSLESLVSASSTFTSLCDLCLRKTNMCKIKTCERFAKLSENLKDLKTLDLSENNLEKFAVEIPKLFSQIETLLLEDCQLQDSLVLQMSENFSQLQNRSLVHFSLSKNTALPTTLVHLAKLEVKRIDYPDCETSPEPPELISMFCNKGNKWQNLGDLNIIKITKNGIEAMKQVLKEAKGIKSFDISKCEPGESFDVLDLLGALSTNCHELHTFNISGHTVTCGKCVSLLDILQTSSKMKRLQIRKCSILEERDMGQVLKNLQKHSERLETIDISENTLGIGGLKELVELTKKCEMLRELNIAKCKCEGKTDLNQLVDNVSKVSLESINLQGQEVTLDCYMKLTELESKNVSVVLPSCEDGSELARYCTLPQKAKEKMDTIDLKGTKLPNESLKNFKSLIKQAKNVTNLKLPQCQEANDADIAALVSEVNKYLKVLDCSNNQLGTTTAKGLKKNCSSLMELYLTNGNMSESACESLLDSICAYSKNIVILDLSGNEIGEKGAIKIIETDEKNYIYKFAMTSLKELILSNCKLPSHAMVNVVRYFLGKCPLLTKIDLSGNYSSPQDIVLLTIEKKKKTHLELIYPNCKTEAEVFIEFCKDSDDEWSKIKMLGRNKMPKAISVNGSYALAMMFEFMPNLKNLDLLEMGEDKLIPILDALTKHCAYLEKFGLYETDITSTAKLQWKQFFAAKTQLTCLTFGKNCKLMTRDKTSLFSCGLQNCRKLEQIFISECGLKHREIGELNECLEKLPNLQEIYLQNIGDVSMLKPDKYNTVHTINLENCTASPVTLARLSVHQRMYKSNVVSPKCSTQDEQGLLDILSGKTGWNSIERLQIDGKTEEGSRALSYVLRFTDKLKSLRIEKKSSDTVQSLIESLSWPKHCISLEELAITDADISKTSTQQWQQIFGSKIQLFSIEFHKCKLLSRDGTSILSYPMTLCAQLRTLIISECELGHNEKAFLNATLEKLQNLEEVHLRHIGDVSVLNIEGYKNMKAIDLEGCTASPVTLALLSIHKREHNSNNVPPVCSIDVGQEMLDILSGKTPWNSIQKLNTKKMTEEGSKALAYILKYTKQLKSFKFVKEQSYTLEFLMARLSEPDCCNSLTDFAMNDTNVCLTSEKQWQRLFESKNMMQCVEFDNCKLLCKDNLSILGHPFTMCKQLRKLVISGANLPRPELQHLNNTLVVLNNVEVIILKQIGDVSGLTPDKYPTSLQTFSLEGCTADPYTLALLTYRRRVFKTEIVHPSCSTGDSAKLVSIYIGNTEWSNLETFEIDDSLSSSGGDALGLIFNHANLSMISLAESKKYNGRTIQKIFAGMKGQTGLEVINFHHSKMTEEEGCFKKIEDQVENMPKLKTLNVGMCSSKHQLLGLVEKLKASVTLETLDFSEVEKVDLWTISELKKLVEKMERQIKYRPPLYMTKDEHKTKKLLPLVQLSMQDIQELEEIDISHCELTSEDVTVVKNVLDKSQKLSKFSMADCKGIKVSDDSFQGVMIKLTELTNLETLDLSGVEIGPQSVQKLAKAPHNSKWKHVYLNRCNLTSMPRLFEDMAKSCKKLSKLHLQGNVLSRYDLNALKTLVKASQNLLQLNIGNCKIFDMKEFQELIKAIEESCPKLSKLCLQNNTLNKDALKALKSLVKASPKLLELNIGNCNIGEWKEFHEVIQAVKESCPELSKLHLENNAFNKDALKALQSLVKTSPKLVELNIGGKITEGKEFEVLLEQIGNHSVLQKIDLRQVFKEKYRKKVSEVMGKSLRTKQNEMIWQIL